MIIVMSLVHREATNDISNEKLFKNKKRNTAYGAIPYKIIPITFPGASVATEEQIITNKAINK